MTSDEAAIQAWRERETARCGPFKEFWVPCTHCGLPVINRIEYESGAIDQYGKGACQQFEYTKTCDRKARSNDHEDDGA